MIGNTSELASDTHYSQAYDYKFHTTQYDFDRKRSTYKSSQRFVVHKSNASTCRKYCQLSPVGNGLVFPMVEVYERGQIVIPKYIRDMLRISPGTQLNVSLDGRKIVLEQYDPIAELDKFREKNAVYTTKELGRIMKEMDKKRHDELMKDVY